MFSGACYPDWTCGGSGCGTSGAVWGCQRLYSLVPGSCDDKANNSTGTSSICYTDGAADYSQTENGTQNGVWNVVCPKELPYRCGWNPWYWSHNGTPSYSCPVDGTDAADNSITMFLDVPLFWQAGPCNSWQGGCAPAQAYGCGYNATELVAITALYTDWGNLPASWTDGISNGTSPCAWDNTTVSCKNGFITQL